MKKKRRFILNKLKIFAFLSEYSLQTVLLFLVVNTVIIYAVRHFAMAQSCMTTQQVSADSRCLYIYQSRVFEKGTKSRPHHGHPCGSDVTSVMESSHRANPATYLDPNMVSTVCTSNPTPSPTPQPTPSPSPSPQPTPSPTLQLTPSPTPTPPASPKITPTPTPTPVSSNTVTPTPTAAPQSTATPKATPSPVLRSSPKVTESPAAVGQQPVNTPPTSASPKVNVVSVSIDSSKAAENSLPAERGANPSEKSFINLPLFTKILAYAGLISIFATVIVGVLYAGLVSKKLANWFEIKK